MRTCSKPNWGFTIWFLTIALPSLKRVDGFKVLKMRLGKWGGVSSKGRGCKQMCFMLRSGALTINQPQGCLPAYASLILCQSFAGTSQKQALRCSLILWLEDWNQPESKNWSLSHWVNFLWDRHQDCRHWYVVQEVVLSWHTSDTLFIICHFFETKKKRGTRGRERLLLN